MKGLDAFRRLVGWFGLPAETEPRQLCYKDKELVEKELKALEIIKTIFSGSLFSLYSASVEKKITIIKLEYGCAIEFTVHNEHKRVYVSKDDYELLKEVLK